MQVLGLKPLIAAVFLAGLTGAALAQSVDPAPGGCDRPAPVPPEAAPAAGAPAANAPESPPTGGCIPTDDPIDDKKAADAKAIEAGRDLYMSGEHEAGFKAVFPYAQAGDRVAENMIGNAYYFGNGVVQSCELGEKWTRRAADQGLDRALFNYGRMKFSGCYGDGIDLDLALDYLERAVAAEFPSSYAWLARLLASGDVGTPDAARIRELLDLGIRSGADNAALTLADLQANGQGLPRDQAAAVEWYRAMALEQGDQGATLGLAEQYLIGVGDAGPDRVAAYALVAALIDATFTEAIPTYARLLIETPGDYWHDPVEGWAWCSYVLGVIGPEYFGQVEAACEELRPMVSTPDLMKAALLAARWR